MRLKLVSLFILITSLGAWAQSGFSRGSHFSNVELEGKLVAMCGSQVEVVFCRDNFMDPWPYDVFIGPKNDDAESVELRSEVGSNVQIIVVNYNGKTGRSADVNLGVQSLFHKALLRHGTNKVQFKLYNKKGEMIENGNFIVQVDRASKRTCPDRETILPSAQDCSYTHSLCQQYFKSLNYCRP